jgi:hypothetical protein
MTAALWQVQRSRATVSVDSANGTQIGGSVRGQFVRDGRATADWPERLQLIALTGRRSESDGEVSQRALWLGFPHLRLLCEHCPAYRFGHGEPARLAPEHVQALGKGASNRMHEHHWMPTIGADDFFGWRGFFGHAISLIQSAVPALTQVNGRRTRV